jgi:UDP-N-acetylmuramate-alanine ligase
LLPEYRSAFDRADQVYITSIEGARETGAEHTVSGNDIVQALHMPALYVPNRADLMATLKRDARPGDVILCFSVSGYDQLAEELASTLGSASAHK